MILLTSLLAGWLAGLLYARWQKRTWTVPPLRFPWFVVIAFLPQFFAFYLPATRTQIPDSLTAVSLIISQILLLAFCWLNRRLAGVWVFTCGTALNLAVIAANGGFMPISPETASRLVPATVMQTVQIGARFGHGKDVLLLLENTRLAWLSDRFLLPAWFPYQVAFSLGDLLIAAGAFWLMLAQGRPLNSSTKSKKKVDDDIHSDTKTIPATGSYHGRK